MYLQTALGQCAGSSRNKPILMHNFPTPKLFNTFKENSCKLLYFSYVQSSVLQPAHLHTWATWTLDCRTYNL